jgi:A/G-specific adenine glycosylase
VRLTKQEISEFQRAVFTHYNERARHELPWRIAEPDGSFDPYKIWVSELMLQQTQVNRVIPKYLLFVERFTTIQALATAQLGDVLIAWQGLGYNRRAKFLWQAALQIVRQGDGKIPDNTKDLMALPGIGHNTAGAIIAYAYNQPALFVETNIRSVYFHHFFADHTDIPDAEIQNLLSQTIDNSNPRVFYWALMDYGTYLKRQGKGRITKSKHYTKQNKFEGSQRQIRGHIIRLLSQGPLTVAKLLDELQDNRAQRVLKSLEEEGFIQLIGEEYRLA